MKRADIDIDDIYAALPKARDHITVDAFDSSQVGNAAAGTGLIGDDDKAIAGLRQLLHRFDVIVEPFEGDVPVNVEIGGQALLTLSL